MAIYEPAVPELGKNAMGRRVAALRALNAAGGAQFTRYSRGDPSYRLTAPNGAVREIATREVAPYVVAHEDAYDAVRGHVEQAMREALVDPDVSDQESLLSATLAKLDALCGEPIQKAAQYFQHDDQDSTHAIA